MHNNSKILLCWYGLTTLNQFLKVVTPASAATYCHLGVGRKIWNYLTLYLGIKNIFYGVVEGTFQHQLCFISEHILEPKCQKKY